MEPTKQQATIASLSALHSKAATGSEAFLAHPAPSDAALHLGAVGNSEKGPAMVPVGLDFLRVQMRDGTSIDQIFGWAVTGKQPRQ